MSPYKHLPFPPPTLKWPKAFANRLVASKVPQTSLYFLWHNIFKGGWLGGLLCVAIFSLPHMRTTHYSRRRTTCASRRKIGPMCQSCQEFFLPLHCFAFFLPTATLQFLHLVIRCLSNVTFSNSLFSELQRCREGFGQISQQHCVFLPKSCSATQDFSFNSRERRSW